MHRQITCVTQAPIGFNVFKSFNIACHLSLQIALKSETLNNRANFIFFLYTYLFLLLPQRDTGFFEDGSGARTTNAKNGCQANIKTLFLWNGDAKYSHLALSLLMSWIGFASYINIALSTDYLALRAQLPDRRLNFHNKSAF